VKSLSMTIQNPYAGPMLNYASGDVPTDHLWNSATYVAEWADTANDAPHRAAIFEAFMRELSFRFGDEEVSIFELGSGPGFLAEQICTHMNVSRYSAIDISPHMHALARPRLKLWTERIAFIETDYRTNGWERTLPGTYDAVVSLQAVHELRHADKIPTLYRSTLRPLRAGGAFLIADVVNAPGHDSRAHLLTTEQHIETLTTCGFAHARCVLDLGSLALIAAEKAT
jgi:SAM-dependent methyltransferase